MSLSRWIVSTFAARTLSTKMVDIIPAKNQHVAFAKRNAGRSFA